MNYHQLVVRIFILVHPYCKHWLGSKLQIFYCLFCNTSKCREPHSV